MPPVTLASVTWTSVPARLVVPTGWNARPMLSRPGQRRHRHRLRQVIGGAEQDVDNLARRKVQEAWAINATAPVMIGAEKLVPE
jgi:hypothetical protein